VFVVWQSCIEHEPCVKVLKPNFEKLINHSIDHFVRSCERSMLCRRDFLRCFGLCAINFVRHKNPRMDFDSELFLSLLENAYVEDCRFISFSRPPLTEMSRAKHWCFTLNNYNQDIIDNIVENAPFYDYIVFGKEVGESGTPHLQGFVSFPSRVRRNYCIEKIGQAHFTVARSVDDSIRYCKKDGDFVEIGTRPVTQGHRSDLESFKMAVIGGCVDMKQLRLDYSEVCAKYPKFVHDFVQDHCGKKMVEVFPLRPWQSALYDSLKHTPDNRTIFFIVDPVGNAGKSWFGHYYCFMHDNAQVLLPGKKADMAYALDPSVRVLFIDAPRSKQGEYLQYDFLEDVKNGFVFCSKYESRVKQMAACHVVVFMNEDPDMNKLSKDRYVIRRVGNCFG